MAITVGISQAAVPVVAVAPEHLLAGLEPIATAGLAVTLAYLALDRFRYRAQVESAAKKIKGEIGAALEQERVLDAWNELRWWAREFSNGHSLITPFALIYRVLYRKSLDVGLVAFGALVCFLTLGFGTALKVNIIHGQSFLDWEGFVHLIFWICLASSALPVTSIFLGRRCASEGVNRSNYCKT